MGFNIGTVMTKAVGAAVKAAHDAGADAAPDSPAAPKPPSPLSIDEEMRLIKRFGKPDSAQGAETVATVPKKQTSPDPDSTGATAAPDLQPTLGAKPVLADDGSDLVAAAAESADEHGWGGGDSLAAADNAHHTNKPSEMREAIEDGHNWFEGDLRVSDEGELVMAHDAEDEDDGLSLDQWLTVGEASERGMKIDVKEHEAVAPMLDALDEHDVADDNLMINIGIAHGEHAGVTHDELEEIRERHPDAWIAINPSSPGTYDDETRDAMIAAAEVVGGRVTFPIQWDLLSDEAIRDLEPHGDVSVWTSNLYGTPSNEAAASDRLRERGVKGMIDLGSAPAWMGPVQSAARTVRDMGAGGALESGIEQVRRAPGRIINTGQDAVNGALDAASQADDVAVVGAELIWGQVTDFGSTAASVADNIPGSAAAMDAAGAAGDVIGSVSGGVGGFLSGDNNPLW